MGKYFGTDGVRGVANRELTPELVYRLGRCSAYLLTKDKEQSTVVVGRDPRLSGEMLESALVAGILSIGVDVIRLGVVTTPAIAFLTRHLSADAGVMISASHNPFEDNGIKFFGADGFKLSDEIELAIEEWIDAPEDNLPRPEGKKIGRVIHRPEAVGDYLEHLKSTIDIDLCGINIVIDCANGAASKMAPQRLRELGADVIAMNCEPDGVNINVDCGSTHPEQLQKEVVQRQAHLGLAFDGDADRLIAVDEQGELVNGDRILYVCGVDLQEKGELKEQTIVATIMSNIGFFKAVAAHGIHTEKTQVGDRHVMQAMRASGSNLGGEQSGHIIFLDYNTTGDGLVTALQLLRVIKEKGQTLSGLAKEMVEYPQILINVPVQNKEGLEENQGIQQKIEEIETLLGDEGRVLVRPSGTEQVIRVMAEGADEDQLRQYVEAIAEKVREELY